VAKLKSLRRKCYGRHNYLLNPHGICYVCSNQSLVLSSFMTYHQVCNKSNNDSAICRLGNAYTSSFKWGSSFFGNLFIFKENQKQIQIQKKTYDTHM
jgi:hypothetical protein